MIVYAWHGHSVWQDPIQCLNCHGGGFEPPTVFSTPLAHCQIMFRGSAIYCIHRIYITILVRFRPSKSSTPQLIFDNSNTDPIQLWRSSSFMSFISAPRFGRPSGLHYILRSPSVPDIFGNIHLRRGRGSRRCWNCRPRPNFELSEICRRSCRKIFIQNANFGAETPNFGKFRDKFVIFSTLSEICSYLFEFCRKSDNEKSLRCSPNFCL